jgi:hypothetical protein
MITEQPLADRETDRVHARARRRHQSALQMNAPAWIRRRYMTIGSRRPAAACCRDTGFGMPQLGNFATADSSDVEMQADPYSALTSLGDLLVQR